VQNHPSSLSWPNRSKADRCRPQSPSVEGTEAFAVDDLNDRGEAVGGAFFEDGTKQAFKTGPNGLGVTLLGTLSHRPGGLSEARGISANGWVSGISTLWPKYSQIRATVTDPQGRVLDLNDRVVNLPPDVHLAGAVAINRHGQIATGGSDGRVYIVCPKEHCKP
jgi:hypothetical protein